jgi:hypothetical protein
LRGELSGGCTFLALTTSITSTVTSLTITVTTTATTSAKRLTFTLTLTTHHSTRRCVRSLLLDVRSRDNLGGEVEPFTEVVEAFRSESVVIVLPWELSLDIATGCKRLAGLDNVEVLGVNIVVLWEVVILLCDKYALSEQVLVDLLAVCLRNKPMEY